MVDTTRHVGTRRELSRTVVIIISGSIATRDGKLADYIRAFPGVYHGKVPLSYSARERNVHVLHRAFRIMGTLEIIDECCGNFNCLLTIQISILIL